MANILIRDLDAGVLARLKAAAKRNGRSLQGEIHDALGRAARSSMAETQRIYARWLKRLRGSLQSDSARFIREDRDTR